MRVVARRPADGEIVADQMECTPDVSTSQGTPTMYHVSKIIDSTVYGFSCCQPSRFPVSGWDHLWPVVQTWTGARCDMANLAAVHARVCACVCALGRIMSSPASSHDLPSCVSECLKTRGAAWMRVNSLHVLQVFVVTDDWNTDFSKQERYVNALIV